MKLSITTLILGLSLTSFAQQCTTFNSYEAQGGSVELLDSLYPSAMHIDSTIAVFHGREREFQIAWITLLQEFGTHLKQNGFVWGEPTRCFNRVYFNKDGGVDTFLFNFLTDEFDPDKEKRFEELLNEYIKGYKLKLDGPATSQFAQCGPATFMDRE